MAKLLIVSSRANAITQTVVEFPHEAYAEAAVAQIDAGRACSDAPPVQIIAVRLYKPTYKAEHCGRDRMNIRTTNRVRKILCVVCRQHHDANLSCAEAAQRTRDARKRRAARTESPVSDWDKLRELIAEYAEAYYADGIKGGGRPEDFAAIEARLELQTNLLNTHIENMERELECARDTESRLRFPDTTGS